ncbi:MAG TPA: thiamine-phosphate kinase [Thermoleophilaceae bacterium]|nr:thiamine-phosphate kinase [Thermoleophilaceae bacterium]
MRELELIAAIRAALGARGGRVVRSSGDDAAVVRARPFAVSSIDTVVEGTHFRRSTHRPADIGWKALATALSDIAAMGADPGEAFVALVLPGDFEDVLELVASMEELAERTGTTIAGGDVASGPALTVTVAVTGWADSQEALVGRDGARPGDLVAVTGELGGSEVGRRHLEAGRRDGDLVGRHLRPQPRLAEGAALARAGVSAMIDLSDGLATDAGHVGAASGVQLVVRLERLPRPPGVTAEEAASGGDDYELLVTVPPERRTAAQEAARLTWIGEVVAAIPAGTDTSSTGPGLVLLGADGARADLRGYEHA